MLRNFLILLACTAMLSCQNESSVKKATRSGYPVIYHVDQEGETPQVGNWVIFDVYMYRGDEIVNSTQMTGRKATVEIKEQLLNDPMSALYESIALLSEGDSITVTQSLDTVQNKPRGFEDFDEIRYDVQMEAIYSQAEYNAYVDSIKTLQNAATEELSKEHDRLLDQARIVINNYNRDEIKTLKTFDNGIKYFLIQEGNGPQPKSGQTVVVHYSGFLLDGTNFDNSYERGQPISFEIGDGRVIKGWDEAISSMKEGMQAIIFIPPEKAYGASGYGEEIPPNAELVFFVSLENVNPR